jgi:hypothetical protein
MSNPLLRPNDPRFQKPEIRDAAGRNQFAEGAESPADSQSSNSVFAPGSGAESRSFLPEYAAQQHSRSSLLLLLAGAGWVAAVFGVISFTGVLTSGWISPLLGIAPAASAWLLAHQELNAASAGAIDASAVPRIRLAHWLGLSALIACASIVASMIYREMNFLPNLF